MKKLLVVLMAAIMVVSFAAVSMAAATVEGDWRAEWVMDESKKPNDDLTFSKYDLRFNFKGKVSDNVDAYLQMAYDNSVLTADKDVIGVTVKEYFVTFKQSWGTLKTGFWDHKLFPSRVLLKPHEINAVNAKDMQFVFDIPVGDAMSFALFMDPDLAKDAMDYDVKFGYKADSWGAEIHYGDNDPSKDDATYVAFDVYYQINDAFKAFVYGMQPGDDFNKAWKDDKGDVILVPVIGAEYKSGPVTTSFEYTLEEKSADYSPYGLKFAYGFNNKVTLEVEYTNVNKDDNKLIIRPRVKF